MKAKVALALTLAAALLLARPAMRRMARRGRAHCEQMATRCADMGATPRREATVPPAAGP